jgi:hypothetical protein
MKIFSFLLLVGIVSACANPLGSLSSLPTGFHPGQTGQSTLPPVLISVSPPVGAIGGSTTLTLTGQNFQSGATVQIGAGSCLNVTFVSATQLTCVSPPHASGDVSIIVTNPDTQTVTLASAFDYVGTSNAVAGFAVLGGGSIATSAAIRLLGSVGGFNPVVQTSGAINNYPGIQGIVSGSGR